MVGVDFSKKPKFAPGEGLPSITGKVPAIESQRQLHEILESQYIDEIDELKQQILVLEDTINGYKTETQRLKTENAELALNKKGLAKKLKDVRDELKGATKDLAIPLALLRSIIKRIRRYKMNSARGLASDLEDAVKLLEGA